MEPPNFYSIIQYILILLIVTAFISWIIWVITRTNKTDDDEDDDYAPFINLGKNPKPLTIFTYILQTIIGVGHPKIANNPKGKAMGSFIMYFVIFFRITFICCLITSYTNINKTINNVITETIQNIYNQSELKPELKPELEPELKPELKPELEPELEDILVQQGGGLVENIAHKIKVINCTSCFYRRLAIIGGSLFIVFLSTVIFMVYIGYSPELVDGVDIQNDYSRSFFEIYIYIFGNISGVNICNININDANLNNYFSSYITFLRIFICGGILKYIIENNNLFSRYNHGAIIMNQIEKYKPELLDALSTVYGRTETITDKINNAIYLSLLNNQVITASGVHRGLA